MCLDLLLFLQRLFPSTRAPFRCSSHFVKRASIGKIIQNSKSEIRTFKFPTLAMAESPLRKWSGQQWAYEQMGDAGITAKLQLLCCVQYGKLEAILTNLLECLFASKIQQDFLKNLGEAVKLSGIGFSSMCLVGHRNKHCSSTLCRGSPIFQPKVQLLRKCKVSFLSEVSPHGGFLFMGLPI